MSEHLIWRLRNNDTAKHLCGLAADEIERLKVELREERVAILELQQEACDRAGVPMPSQRSVVDGLRAALQSIANNTCCEGCQEAARVAKAALSPADGAESAPSKVRTP